MHEHKGAGMSDDPMDRVPASDRISIRAVLVRDGEDASAALAAAGIVDAVALPVFVGEGVDLSGGILGDGLTANPIAVLETEQEEASKSSSGGQPVSSARSSGDTAQRAGPITTTLPAAFGMQPLAPVRSLGG
jgi:hypothetical protein